MKFKTKKILIAILFVISLVINILCIRSTYAKYQELVDTDYQVGIRKWLISVNGKDIQDETTLMSTVLQPILIENEHMKSNVIVPGREGYFEIDLDYTQVDVPFMYSFDVQQLNTTKLSDLDFYGYAVVDECSGFEIDSITGEITYVGLEEGTTTETVDASTGNKKVEFVQNIIDAETGAEKNKILTATLSIPTESTPEDEEEPVDSETDTDTETVADTTTETVVGKVSQVTEKTVDVTTGDIIEEEKVIFKLEQMLETITVTDTNNNTTTTTEKVKFRVTQPTDPTQLESFERYQNLGVYFRWNDAEDNQMDNLADNQFRGEANPDANVDNTLLKYQATLKFKQYVQE